MSGAGQATGSNGYSYESGSQPDNACPAGQPLAQAVLAKLIKAHKSKQPGGTSSFEPVSTEMVETALCQALAKPGTKPAWLRPIAEQVAESLRDDATAGPRLQAFADQIQSLAQASTQ